MYKFMSKKHIFSNNSKSIDLRPPNTIEVEQESDHSGTFGTIFMSLSVIGTEICQKYQFYSFFYHLPFPTQEQYAQT